MICASLLMMGGSSLAQKAMTPPHVMVVPDLIYCKSHGFTQQFNNGAPGFFRGTPLTAS